MWEHNSWGDNIYFLDYGKREIGGHFKTIIIRGDIIYSKMESGKIGVFKVHKIKFMTDPPDQFFGKLKDVGYL